MCSITVAEVGRPSARVTTAAWRRTGRRLLPAGTALVLSVAAASVAVVATATAAF